MYSLSEEWLRKNCKVFEDILSQPSIDKAVRLPDVDPAIFKLYLEAAVNDILTEEQLSSRFEWLELAKTYLLADRLGDSTFELTLRGAFFHKAALFKQEKGPLYDLNLVEFVYRNSLPKSPLRTILVDLSLGNGPSAELFDTKDLLERFARERVEEKTRRRKALLDATRDADAGGEPCMETPRAATQQHHAPVVNVTPVINAPYVAPVTTSSSMPPVITASFVPRLYATYASKAGRIVHTEANSKGKPHHYIDDYTWKGPARTPIMQGHHDERVGLLKPRISGRNDASPLYRTPQSAETRAPLKHSQATRPSQSSLNEQDGGTYGANWRNFIKTPVRTGHYEQTSPGPNPAPMDSRPRSRILPPRSSLEQLQQRVSPKDDRTALHTVGENPVRQGRGPMKDGMTARYSSLAREYPVRRPYGPIPVDELLEQQRSGQTEHRNFAAFRRQIQDSRSQRLSRRTEQENSGRMFETDQFF